MNTNKPPIDEKEVTLKVNLCLMAFADDVIRRWNEIAHLGECHATIEATRLCKKIDFAVRALREENFTFLTKRENSE